MLQTKDSSFSRELFIKIFTSTHLKSPVPDLHENNIYLKTKEQKIQKTIHMTLSLEFSTHWRRNQKQDEVGSQGERVNPI